MTVDKRRSANDEALKKMRLVEPELVGVLPASEAMKLPKNVILTAGPTLPFDEYFGGQRSGIIGGALYEGLASTEEEAVEAFTRGDIQVRGCQEFDCVGSLAGVTTASMPVFVVQDKHTDSQAFCTLYEGDATDRLNYGSFTAQTRANLDAMRVEVGPALNDLIERQAERVNVKHIMVRALAMGDDLHSRNAAATALLFRALAMGATGGFGSRAAFSALKDDYAFLRLSMASSKVLANAMRGVEHSSVVTAMAFSCKEFGIQVSGLGDKWFTGPVPTFVDYKIENGLTLDDMEIMGGESVITETIGLGGMSQAAAFPLVRASGGDVGRMVERTVEMYDITVAESPDFLIPALNYRGAPTGIDVEKVAAHQRPPYLNIGMAGKSKRQIGGGVAVAPLEPFVEAWKEVERQGH
jgi:hypothetical protein